MIFKSILIFLIAFFLSNFLLLKIVPLFGKYLLDKPNFRSSHEIPIPTGGGLSFVALSIIGSFINMINFGPTILCISPIFCLPIAIVGFIDDRIKLSASLRYLAQLVTVYFIINNTVFLDYELSSISDYLTVFFLLFFGLSIF